jgi:hypothetical protein
VGSTPGTIEVEAVCGAFTDTVTVEVAGVTLPDTGTGDGENTGMAIVWSALVGLAAIIAGAGLYRRVRRLS